MDCVFAKRGLMQSTIFAWLYHDGSGGDSMGGVAENQIEEGRSWSARELNLTGHG